MLEIPCPLCSRAFHPDELHGEVSTGTYPDFRTAQSVFRSRGCTAFGLDHDPLTLHNDDAMMAQALYELYGYDFDAVADDWDEYTHLQGE